MERKDFLKLSAYAGAFAAVANVSWLMSSCRKMDMDMDVKYVPVIEGKFDWPMAIPNIIQASAAQLSAAVVTTSVIKDKSTRVLGYQSGILGPTLTANSGDQAQILFRNELSEESNIHWHGLMVPANMDGNPADTIPSGGSKNYSFALNQRAGTYWYHPHAHGKTASQVFKGLAGLFTIKDAEEDALALPSGNYEVPLIIQDKRFYPDYSLNYAPKMAEIMSGYLGDHILINGRYAPYFEVATRWYRFRVLNGSTARVYNLALSNGAAFYVIGSDGGLLPSPQSVTELLVAPGERADILIDFSGYSVGSTVYLQSNSFAGGVQGGQTFKLLKCSVTQQSQDNFNLPTTLSLITPIPENTAVRTRNFEIAGTMEMGGGHGGHGGGDMQGMHTINGKVFDMDRIDEVVQQGQTEIWVFDNSNGDEIHPMHIHGVQFQVLDRAGGRGVRIPTELGWKDTVMCMPGEIVRVIMTFPSHTGKFVLHCHNLEHEDDGMMLNFQIN